MHTCSFCGKSEYQVGLYGGPQVAICTECVRTMYEDIGPLEPCQHRLKTDPLAPVEN